MTAAGAGSGRHSRVIESPSSVFSLGFAGQAPTRSTAADAIPAADRDRTVGTLARARQHAAAGAHHEAVTAVAEAIAVHAAAIDASRRDATVRLEHPPVPPQG